MFGGDLRNIDQWTSDLITQPIVLEMNAHSTHNREVSTEFSRYSKFLRDRSVQSVHGAAWNILQQLADVIRHDA